MPKKKEVHLKKLMNAAEESDKEPEAKVKPAFMYLIIGIERETDCVVLAL